MQAGLFPKFVGNRILQFINEKGRANRLGTSLRRTQGPGVPIRVLPLTEGNRIPAYMDEVGDNVAEQARDSPPNDFTPNNN